MGYISEDYCSEELSGMLMERGYIGATNTYLGKDDINVVQITLQSAMKWLREVHNKQCNIELNFYSKWHFLVVDTKVTEIDHYEEMKSYPTDNSDGFPSYEQAAEAAIKYCLENLI